MFISAQFVWKYVQFLFHLWFIEVILQDLIHLNV